MASKSAVRSLQSLARGPRPTCECANAASRAAAFRQLSTKTYTPMRDETANSSSEVAEERPRWSHTPPRMKAAFPFRIKDTRIKWECNSDPARLDRFYDDFLGIGGNTLLTEEVKWLAVTHKSFDQGRRGFNDRLAFLGRRILSMQLNLALLNSTPAKKTQRGADPDDNRKPYQHPSLESLQNVVDIPISEVLTKERIGGLATQFGMRDIVRWVPRNLTNLDASGVDVVLTSAVYAIVGAIALQRGGDVAAEVARQKILSPLGIK